MWSQYVAKNPNSREEFLWTSKGGYERKIGFEPLLQYGMGSFPNSDPNPTVVYNTWFDAGMPKMICGKEEIDNLYKALVIDFLRVNDLDMIITGHQPIGDTPFTIQLQDDVTGNRKYVICADNSYSGDTFWVNHGSSEERQNPGRGEVKSGRGPMAVTEIVIDECVSAQQTIMDVRYHGKMSDGSQYDFRLLPSDSDDDDDTSFVGKLVDRNRFSLDDIITEQQNMITERKKNGENVIEDVYEATDWFINAKLPDDTFLLTKGQGYNFYNAIMRKSRSQQ